MTSILTSQKNTHNHEFIDNFEQYMFIRCLAVRGMNVILKWSTREMRLERKKGKDPLLSSSTNFKKKIEYLKTLSTRPPLSIAKIIMDIRNSGREEQRDRERRRKAKTIKAETPLYFNLFTVSCSNRCFPPVLGPELLRQRFLCLIATFRNGISGFRPTYRTPKDRECT